MRQVKISVIALLVIAFILLAGCKGVSKSDINNNGNDGLAVVNSGYKKYLNQDKKYQIEYPENFKIQTEMHEGEYDENRESRFYEAFVAPENNLTITIESVKNSQLYTIQYWISKIVPSDVKYEKTTINGLDALKTESGEEYKDTTTIIFDKFNNKIFMISVFEHSNDKSIRTEKGMSIYNKMLESFSIIKS